MDHIHSNDITYAMKYLLALFFFAPVAAFAQGDDEATLRHFKQVQWPKAYREQDTVLLDRLLATEFQLIDAGGEVTNKRDELAYIKAHKPGYTSFVYTIDRLDVFENGTAIVSGTGLVTGTDPEGKPYRTTYKSSNVLIRRAGRWQAISSHVSGVKRQ
jgi:ketosteroid isomerase-like protein